MRLRSWFLIVCLAVSALASLSTPATLTPILDLSRLARTSDTILVGRVIGITEVARTSVEMSGRKNPAREMVAQLMVDKVLKGSPSSSVAFFHFILPDEFLGYGSITVGQYAVFLLGNRSDTLWVVDPYYPAVVAYPGASMVAGADLDQIVAEVAHALISSPDPSVRWHAVRTLFFVETPGATAALTQTANGKDTSIRPLAIAALLRRNDLSFLNEATGLLLRGEKSENQEAVRNFAYAIRDGIKNSDAIPTLKTLLYAPDSLVRQAAVAALANTRNSKAVAPLAKALQDEDQRVRYEAVFGLAKIAGQPDWTPSFEYFIQEEQRFLEHWKDWAKSQEQKDARF